MSDLDELAVRRQSRERRDVPGVTISAVNVEDMGEMVEIDDDGVFSYYTPENARKIADALVKMADIADGATT